MQKMKRFMNLRTAIAGLALLTFAGCTSESNVVPSSPRGNVYLQVDRLGNPGVKEIFELFTDHSTSNRAIPSNDPVLKNAITTLGGATAATKLYPDVLHLNLSASGNASYLDTTGFGGRSLIDDVMSANLNLAYGPSAPVPVPCVVTDNVTASAATATASSGTFPYVAGPQ